MLCLKFACREYKSSKDIFKRKLRFLLNNVVSVQFQSQILEQLSDHLKSLE
jgi:hypothetical protein